MWLFLAFVAVPILEIALFIKVGGAIGTLPTIGIVILTAILGTTLMRAQGAAAMNDLRRSFSEMRDPTEPIAHGAMILVAGVLLLTPGFFTDAVGLSLLIPPVRRAVFSYLRKRIKVQSFTMHSERSVHRRHTPANEDIIDGDFEEFDPEAQQVEPPRKPTHRPSGWTKH